MGSFRQNAFDLHARSSDSHFKQLVNEGAKAPPPLFSQGAGSAGYFHPLAHEGRAPSQCEGAERRKARVILVTPCGARPVRWAFTSRRSTAAFFLSPRDCLLKTDRGGLYGTPLIQRAFTRLHPLPLARCRTDPRSGAGRALPRLPEMSVRDPSAGAEPVPPFRRL